MKVMFPFRKVRDVDAAALQNSGPGDGYIRETAGALRHRTGDRSIQLAYEATAEVLHFGEGMRLPALVNYVERGAFGDFECEGSTSARLWQKRQDELAAERDR